MLPQNRWLVLAIVSSALFLIVVDMTVLYTALPRLTHDLAASASEKLWIMNIYPLVVAGLLPGLGTLGDKLGHKRMFMNGLAVFGLASLCAAYSPNPEILIAARAFLACGAAMMMPATLACHRHMGGNRFGRRCHRSGRGRHSAGIFLVGFGLSDQCAGRSGCARAFGLPP